MREPTDTSSELAAAEDRRLMARVQEGDEAALGALMNEWELPIKAFLARIVLNAAEAEDLAQETFVRVWQQRAKFRSGAEFRPWIFAIAVNLARNRLRWWRRRPTVSLEAWSDPEGQGANQRFEREAVRARDDGRDADPHQSTVRAERAAAVRDAIGALPAELREALVLFEYEEMSQAEIAAVVGTTPKAVETRIYRAREKLRTLLRGLG